MTAFSRFDPRLQNKIVTNLGWTSLRPVQEEAAHAILDGKNCIVLAPTAGGKTEASIFPVLSECLSNAQDGLRAIYVCPTRALINNQEERLSRYVEMVGLAAFKWHGDVTASEKKAFVREPAELLLTTPESLEVMLDSASVPTAQLFKNLRFVIVDEIHSLAACDRGGHLLCVFERLRAYATEDFQRIGLSATVGNPGHIQTWLQGSSLRESLLIDPPKKISPKTILVHSVETDDTLEALVMAKARGIKSLLFCESRRLAERVAGVLKKTGEPVFVHHSSLSKEEREYSEAKFSKGKEACIVCTSTMELGIDVGDLDAVLQINAPRTVSSFLQRMGRTGRREGAVANTTFFTEEDEFVLRAIAIVELARNHFVEPVRTNPKAWHLLLHQIMAFCLERGGVKKDEVWNILRPAFCFSQISEKAYSDFFDYLVKNDFLHDDGVGYSMGLRAEKTFGQKNFMELYSVFSTPVEFEVSGLAGTVIGTIEGSFLEKLLENDTSFYLSGQAWVVDHIEWRKKIVYVTKSPAGKIPQWGSIMPGFSGYELCRAIRDVIVSNDTYSYLDLSAKHVLEGIRSDLQSILSSSFAPIFQDHKDLIWYTYAGGYVNTTLRFALELELNCEVVATDFSIKIKNSHLLSNEFPHVLKKITDRAYWDDLELPRKMLTLMPNYRLSKFQDYLPMELQLNMIAESLLDIENTIRFFADLSS